MDQGLVRELLTEIAKGLMVARSRSRNPDDPAASRMFDQNVTRLHSTALRALSRDPRFAVIIGDGAFCCQDARVEPDRDPALTMLREYLDRQNISSITFASGITEQDVALFLSGLAGRSGHAQRPAAIELNAPDAMDSLNKPGLRQSPEAIIKAIRGLIEIVKRHGAFSDAKAPFARLVGDIESAARNDWHSYCEAMASVVEFLPCEKRIALLQDLELQPFALMLLARLEDETIIELITNWERQSRNGHIVKTLAMLDQHRLPGIVGPLKHRQIGVYEHLFSAGVDLLADEGVARTIGEDDLNAVLRQYHGMLTADIAEPRSAALKSLIKFAGQQVGAARQGMVDALVQRIVSALDKEPSDQVIEAVLDDSAALCDLLCRQGDGGSCEKLVGSLGGILGRAGAPAAFKKKIIGAMIQSRHPSALHLLFSLLWESGLYPDVRAAIVGFGPSAAKEAVQLLRYAEEFSVRMKLIDVLKHMGEQGLEVLKENLDAREWFLRRNIVRILGEIAEPGVHSHLDRMLADEDHRVRLEVVRAYEKLNDKAGLIRSLGDRSAEVKAEALRGLRSMIDGGEFMDLLPQLDAAGDEVYVELLKTVDDKRIAGAMHWIGDLMRRLEWRRDQTADEIKALGLDALARLGGAEAKQLLFEFAQSKDSRLAERAQNALRRMG